MRSSCGVQTSIKTDGYRSLAEQEEVEFDVETGDDGRTKAVNVTGPGGAPPKVTFIPRKSYEVVLRLTTVSEHDACTKPPSTLLATLLSRCQSALFWPPTGCL